MINRSSRLLLNLLFRFAKVSLIREAVVTGIYSRFQEKCLFMSTFLNKFAGLQPEEKLLHRCFTVIFA